MNHYRLICLTMLMPLLIAGCRAAADTWVRPADSMIMLHVPAGSFLMGAEDGEPEADRDEFPQHRVSLDAFWIDRTEVTNAQFRLFVDASGYKTTAEGERAGYVFTVTEGWALTAGVDWRHPAGPDSDLLGLDQHPVAHVTWYDAQAYCEWAGARLPTEAEWEYAARGPQANRYPWGDAFEGDRLNFCDSNCDFDWADEPYDDGYARTAPVGSYPAGASWIGALDMAGNVWEWLQDWDDSNYYDHSPSRNPAGPSTGTSRVLRGGSWSFNSHYVRSADRDFDPPDRRYDDYGFRCASPRIP